MTLTPHAAARWRAPGRVNLIGEHTDYNDGYTLPFAIEHGCTAQVRRTDDGVLRARSAQQAEPAVVQLGHAESAFDGQPGWARYVLGPAWLLHRRGLDVPGLEISVDSDVPVGAGLSSSAAVVCAVARALDEELGLGMTDDEMLALTRAVENDVVGAPTGGMDQLAALRSRAGHVLFCDMRDLTTELVPFEPGADGLTMLVVDTRAPHRHSDGEYAARRRGCEQAAAALGLPSLRELEIGDLDDVQPLLDEEQRRYARHVVTENQRVLEVVALLRASRVADIGPALTASHSSMRDDFRITVPQVDVAVDALLESGALGARMTGGGFGGCVIGLIDTALVEDAVKEVARAFTDSGFGPPEAFDVRPGPGAHRVVPD